MKIIMSFAIAAVFALFSSVSVSSLEIVTGEFEFDRNTPGFSLSKGEGDRQTNLEVKFKKPFSSKPKIVLSVTRIDASNDENLRYELAPSFVSNDGFLIKAKTWDKSKVYTIKGTWMAIAQ